MTPARHPPSIALGALLALVAALAVSLSVADPAAAKSACGAKVLGDWYDNGRIDRLYPLHCYEDAIDLIPRDLLPYADAEEVISRALAQALRDELAPGGCDPSPDGSEDDCKGSSGGKPSSGKPNGGKPSGGKPSGGKPSGGTTGEETTTGSEVVPAVDTSAASTVPTPLLVLGGMSIALLAAGGLGYASRRRQGADGGGLGDDDPLA